MHNKASFAAWSGDPFSRLDVHKPLPGQWAVQSAPKVFLRFCLGFWQNSHDVPQQRLCSFKGSLDPLILVVSVVLFWVFGHPACCVFSAGFWCEVVELWNTNITWQGTILTDFCIFQSLRNLCLLDYSQPGVLSENFTSLVWVKGPSPVLHQGQWSGEKSRDTKLQSVLFLIPSHTWCTCILYLACTPGAQAGSGWPKILGERKAAEVWHCPELPEEKVKSEMGMGAGWGSLGEPQGTADDAGASVGIVGIYLARLSPFCISLGKLYCSKKSEEGPNRRNLVPTLGASLPVHSFFQQLIEQLWSWILL